MSFVFPDSVLLTFCKAPVPGRVKTRLQPMLSAEQAVAAHVQLAHLTLKRAFAQPLCAVQLYCAPDTRHDFFQQCVKDYALTLFTQNGSDLGSRMLHAFKQALARYRYAILMGCDCPSLTTDDLRQALLALQNGADAVIAPAEDGGYVLIGLHAPQAVLFQNMPWGSNQVAAQTRQRAAQAGLTVYELGTQWDVDYAKDWQRFLNAAIH
jgi:uncharacterized protein